MNWTRRDNWFWESDEGYRIAAARVNDCLRYSAFAPAMDYEIFKDRMKLRYRRGEPVPQQREPLGCFDDPNAARAACVVHHQAQTQTAVTA
jgi:hypothetical protein